MLKSTVAHGTLWSLVGYGGMQALRLISNLLLAKLLAPDAFGMMALVAVFMQGLEMFSDIGLTPSIVQNKRGEEPAFLHSAWTLQIIRGFALWLCACAIAWPVSQFYAASHPDAGQLAVILPVVAISTILGGFTSTAVPIIRRRMELSKLAAFELLPQLLSVITMLLWAIVDRSVWALVAGWLANSVLRLIMSFRLLLGHRDHLGWDAAAVRELVRFGRWVFASTALSFIVISVDRLMLGRLMTLAELGVYSIAMAFARMAIDIVSRLNHAVVFPVLSRQQDDVNAMLDSYLDARARVLRAAGVFALVFLICAPVFFDFCYDSRYETAGRIAQWLVIYVWSWLLVASIDRVPLALGRPRVLFMANVVAAASMVPALFLFRAFGLPAFIIGLALGQLGAMWVVVRALPTGRTRCHIQSLGVSTIGALYAALSLYLLLSGAKQSVPLNLLLIAPPIIYLLVAERQLWRPHCTFNLRQSPKPEKT